LTVLQELFLIYSTFTETMDLLGGYGSDDSGSSADEAPKPAHPSTAAAKPRPSAPTTKTSRRGKRIVSLHAVLPTHILDQLEKSTATGDLDSDDEYETVATKPPTQDAKCHAVVGKDEGLSSFLSELKSAPTTTFLGGGSGASPDEKPAAFSQPLGQAFATTTSVVVSRGSDDKVVDVHAKKPGAISKANPRKMESGVAKTPATRASMPSAPRPSVSVPRPGMNRPVVSAVPMAPQPGQVPMQQAPYYQPPKEEEPKMDALRAKKRTRKEMEKALRSGNLDALQDSDMTTLEAEGSVYIPQEETYAVPRSGAVRVAPVRMYDPKAGTDVVQADVTGKQRGKHQINQLLASAANLELQRARAIGGGVKNKRADAKRKYGW